MQNENMAGNAGLYATWRSDGSPIRRIPVREIWNPATCRFEQATAQDVPPELTALDYPYRGQESADIYQSRCLAVLERASGNAARPHPINARRSAGNRRTIRIEMMPESDLAAPGCSRAAVQARSALAALRIALVDRPCLLTLLDSFDAHGDGRFDFVGTAAKCGVSLATVYRWRGELAAIAKEVMP